ncbi:Major facilitator superfamily domain, general substrate transporter [Akanthomyces lecanii RCEF 1005]|uniref:Major facilitator superfamily domain, general substrate transporter n=1 Tax=Akanthomyces lecanii RCEF 1005 TaxID=1081108 RepID=A0A168IBA0_CORDF|nr:Major facilitator superfamily domain, general substrate transporter [Akanthomyces lecanii RCEF 1005]
MISGLAYLGLGIGMIISIVLFAVFSDKLLHQPREGTLERPELRLILMMWSTPVIPIGFFWYGWSADKVTHWILPILGTLVIGLGAFLTLMPAQLYLGDAFGTEAAASALVANTVLCSLFGALLPLAGPAMYETLGLGWGNSLLAFITLFRQDATAELKETFVRELKQLRHLPSVLNQSLVVGGPSVTDPIERSKGYHYALVSYHKDKAALETYQASSEHHRQVSSTTITKC